MAQALSRVIRVRFENGVLKPFKPLVSKEGEEVIAELKEGIIEFARRIRGQIHAHEEPAEMLSGERERFE